MGVPGGLSEICVFSRVFNTTPLELPSGERKINIPHYLTDISPNSQSFRKSIDLRLEQTDLYPPLGGPFVDEQ